MVPDHITLSLWLAGDLREFGGGCWGFGGGEQWCQTDAQAGSIRQYCGSQGNKMAMGIFILFLPFCPFLTTFSSKRNFFTGSLTRKLYYI